MSIWSIKFSLREATSNLYRAEQRIEDAKHRVHSKGKGVKYSQLLIKSNGSSTLKVLEDDETADQ